MKTVIYITLLVIFASCRGQNVQNNIVSKNIVNNTSIDTLSTLALQNKQYGSDDYHLLYLRSLDSRSHWTGTSKNIDLIKNSKIIASILLPNSVVVKNFSISKIEETKKGFKIVANWGSGNYFYGREFYFIFNNGKFYLDRLEMSSYIQDADKETKTSRKINPPIPIGKFDIIQYLENE